VDDRYQVEVLGSQAKRDFSCGVDALDRYLLRQASQDHRKGVAVGYLIDGYGDGESCWLLHSLDRIRQV